MIFQQTTYGLDNPLAERSRSRVTQVQHISKLLTKTLPLWRDDCAAFAHKQTAPLVALACCTPASRPSHATGGMYTYCVYQLYTREKTHGTPYSGKKEKRKTRGPIGARTGTATAHSKHFRQQPDKTSPWQSTAAMPALHPCSPHHTAIVPVSLIMPSELNTSAS